MMSLFIIGLATLATVARVFALIAIFNPDGVGFGLARH